MDENYWFELKTMIAEFMVQQCIDMSNGLRFNNEAKRKHQLEKQYEIINDFLENNPQFK